MCWTAPRGQHLHRMPIPSHETHITQGGAPPRSTNQITDKGRGIADREGSPLCALKVESDNTTQDEGAPILVQHSFPGQVQALDLLGDKDDLATARQMVVTAWGLHRPGVATTVHHHSLLILRHLKAGLQTAQRETQNSARSQQLRRTLRQLIHSASNVSCVIGILLQALLVSGAAQTPMSTLSTRGNCIDSDGITHTQTAYGDTQTPSAPGVQIHPNHSLHSRGTMAMRLR